MAEIRDHGIWRRYYPTEEERKGIPHSAAFLRRESDGFDWYEYVNVEEDNEDHKGRVKQFQDGTVKLVIDMIEKDAEGEAIVRTSAVDETRLFPQDALLLELLGDKREQDEARLIEEYCNRYIDPKSGTLGKKREFRPPPPDDRVMRVLNEIMTRLDRMEAATKAPR